MKKQRSFCSKVYKKERDNFYSYLKLSDINDSKESLKQNNLHGNLSLKNLAVKIIKVMALVVHFRPHSHSL